MNVNLGSQIKWSQKWIKLNQKQI